MLNIKVKNWTEGNRYGAKQEKHEETHAAYHIRYHPLFQPA